MVEIVDLEKRVEDGIGRIHVEELHVRQHPLHRLGKWFPPAAGDAAPARRLEVVDEEKPALLEIRAKARRLAVVDRPPADFDEIRDRILEELRIVERHRVDVVVRVEEAHLVHDLDKVALRDRIAVDPGRTPAGPEAAGRGTVSDADERVAAVVRDVGQRGVHVAAIALESKLRVRDSARRPERGKHQRKGHPAAHAS